MVVCRPAVVVPALPFAPCRPGPPPRLGTRPTGRPHPASRPRQRGTRRCVTQPGPARPTGGKPATRRCPATLTPRMRRVLPPRILGGGNARPASTCPAAAWSVSPSPRPSARRWWHGGCSAAAARSRAGPSQASEPSRRFPKRSARCGGRTCGAWPQTPPNPAANPGQTKTTPARQGRPAKAKRRTARAWMSSGHRPALPPGSQPPQPQATGSTSPPPCRPPVPRWPAGLRLARCRRQCPHLRQPQSSRPAPAQVPPASQPVRQAGSPRRPHGRCPRARSCSAPGGAPRSRWPRWPARALA